MTFFAVVVLSMAECASAQPDTGQFSPVPELPYRVDEHFFKVPRGVHFIEASGVALDSRDHVFVFHRASPMLMEFDQHGNFVRTVAEGLWDHPHGLRIDPDDNIWTTDDGNHLVLKLNHDGQVLMVLGRKDWGGEADWLFNKPTDVAFGKNGDIFISDGYGNSRVVKFDRNGRFIKVWGSHGSRPGEFNLPHSIAVDDQGRVYVGDRENQRIQIFDSDGQFLNQWTGIGYPYGLFITKDQHVWVADGGYDRVVELDPSGKILGALGEPGHGPGQFAWAHFLAIGRDRKIFVADVLNWRVQVFVPTAPTGRMTQYVPSARMFWDFRESSGWRTRQSVPKK